jgi:hypothetical protein
MLISSYAIAVSSVTSAAACCARLLSASSMREGWQPKPSRYRMLTLVN